MADAARDLLLALRVACRHEWPRVLRLWAGAAGSQLLLLGAAAAVKYLVDGAVHHDAREAVVAAAVMAGLTGAVTLCFRGIGGLVQTLTERSVRNLDEVLMRAAGTMSLAHHERPADCDRLTVLREQRRRVAYVAHDIEIVVALSVQLTGAVVLLARADPFLLLLPAIAGASLAGQSRANRLLDRAALEVAAASRVRRELLMLVTSAGAAKELRVFGATGAMIDRQQAAAAAADAVVDRATVRATLIRCAAGAVFALGYVGGVSLVLLRAVQGEATAGDVVLVITLAANINRILGTAAQETAYIGEIIAAARHLRWLLSPERREDASAGPAHAAPQSAAGTGPRPMPERGGAGIVVSGVDFRYAGGVEDALTDVTLDLRPGSVVALVGENGSGKTTLVKLLLSMHAPTRGTITVDGRDLRDIDPEAWRGRSSAAFQDFCRFELIIREAVGCGDVTHIGDPEAVRAAAERAGALRTIEALPAGVETQLGATWHGVELSSGQWQKLALGRAMMRPGPRLLVFDEPTAVLDPHSEHDLFERVAEHVRHGGHADTVTVLVSHRFSTVRMADHIVVLRQGRVVETGGHEALVAQGGLYAELHALHARAYR